MKNQTELFPNGDDTPLFSGLASKAKESVFAPKEPQPKQLFMLTSCEKCKDAGTVKVKGKLLPCPYCQD